MTLSNPWFILAVIGTLVVFHLEGLATLLNMSRLGRPIPPSLSDAYPEENRERLVEYISDSARQSFVERSASLALLILVWSIGGFGYVERLSGIIGQWMAHSLGLTVAENLQSISLLTSLAGLSVLASGQMLVSVGFEAWRTFGLETRHGFNRTTPATFVADHLKSLVLSALIGLPLAAAIIWFFQTQPLAALYSWLLVAAFTVLMTWLAPRLLMPLFLKFQPLAPGELRDAILNLSAKLQFPVSDVSIVDGSRRSTKANAFFAGFGKTRRIALFDTLLTNHGTDEILAILAHEIGHNKCRHVPVHMALGLLEMALLFGLLHIALRSPSFYAAFGVAHAHIGIGLALFGILYQPLGVLTGVVSQAISRKHEFEADAFAAEAMQSPAPLACGLRKLSHDHLSHPQPHPMMVWLHYSHPPLAERLRALER